MTEKLGVLSDTHGLLEETKLAVQIFRDQRVTAVIHCGDIGGSEIVRAFQGIPTHFVFGNSDGEDESAASAARETGNRLHGWFGSLELAGKRIAFLHGHQNTLFEETLASGKWDLICYGHTHSASLQTYNSAILLNPGAFRRVARPSVAVVDLPELAVRRFDI
ncbi:MAG: YfcE family phosphodiesterase [Planctomycetaceae bacterium]|jgi:putative phosphoesterase|nr:YfcE family phosphodiesterase [Planctomycetaceae bacterium]